MHRLRLDFEVPSVEAQFRDAVAERFRKIVLGAATLDVALKTTMFVPEVTAYGALSLLNVAWGLLPLIDVGDLLGSSSQALVAGWRIVDAILRCVHFPLFSFEWKVLEFVVQSGILVHVLQPLLTDLHFPLVLPTQIFVTILCLMVTGTRACETWTCETWMGTLGIPEVAQRRVEAMASELKGLPSKHNVTGCSCLKVVIVLHVFIGLVFVPYVSWYAEHSFRVRFLNAIPDNRRSPRMQSFERIPYFISVLHVGALIYVFSMLWEVVDHLPDELCTFTVAGSLG